MTDAPPPEIIAAALASATSSPCQKSKRGVAIWSRSHTRDDEARLCSRGCNAPPDGFGCDGSDPCKGTCALRCEHAEAAAIRRMTWTGAGFSMLHVKAVDGLLVPSGGPSGGPSCLPCATAILADERIEWMWLYHGPWRLGAGESGWRRYGAREFYLRSCEAVGAPTCEEGT